MISHVKPGAKKRGHGYNSGMRRLLLLCALGALAVAAAASAASPKLMVVDRSAFTVRGTTFHAGEHVLVSVNVSGKTYSKRMTAGQAGGFLARFTAVFVPRCASYVVSARGDMGSRAGLRVIPECAEPVTP